MLSKLSQKYLQYEDSCFFFKIIDFREIFQGIFIYRMLEKKQNRCHIQQGSLDTDTRRSDRISETPKYSWDSREHFELGLKQTWNSILMSLWHRDRENPYEQLASRAIYTISNRVTRERRCIVYVLNWYAMNKNIDRTSERYTRTILSRSFYTFPICDRIKSSRYLQDILFKWNIYKIPQKCIQEDMSLFYLFSNFCTHNLYFHLHNYLHNIKLTF